jgi:uncharacterized protein YciI
MEHDLQLRAAARAIYDACYPREEGHRAGLKRLNGSGRFITGRPSAGTGGAVGTDGRAGTATAFIGGALIDACAAGTRWTPKGRAAYA